jgi:uncharacterized protein (TIGR02588 family)
MTGPGEGDGRGPRSGAEWVTLVVAAAVLVALLSLIAAQIPKDETPPAPTATPGRIVERNGRWVVPVEVENEGDETAENVQVEAKLVVDGEEHGGDQVIDFLAADDVAEVEFVFGVDPAEGDLEVVVTGYTVP